MSMAELAEKIDIGAWDVFGSPLSALPVYVLPDKGRWKVEWYDGEYSWLHSAAEIREFATLLIAAADRADELNR